MKHEDAEFLPIPFYGFDERPATMDVPIEEAATAIYLERGDLAAAAVRLKISELRMGRVVRRSLRLQRLLEDFGRVLVGRAVGVVARALDSDDNRRQEWGASKVLSSRIARDHFLAPSNDGTGGVTVNAEGSNIIFKWRTAPLPAEEDDGLKDIKVIDG